MRGFQKSRKTHTIHYVLPNGKKKAIKADVYAGKTGFDLTVTMADLERAEKLGGVGTTQTCMMAVCADRHADMVPHPFETVEWTESRAYFITEWRPNRNPKCIVYRHDDKMAAMFDSPSGRRELRKILKAEGKISVQLHPVPVPGSRSGTNPKGKNFGARAHIVPKSNYGSYKRLQRAIPFFQEAQLAQIKD
jgi:hypothetical protein